MAPISWRCGPTPEAMTARPERQAMRRLRWIDAGMALAAAAALASLIAEYGFTRGPAALENLHAVEGAAALVFCGLQFLKLFVVPSPLRFLWRSRLEFAMLFVLGFQFLAAAGLESSPEAVYLSHHGAPVPLAAATIIFVQAYFLAVAGLHSTLLQKALLRLRLQPAQTLLLSFLVLIAAGTALLCLPKAAAGRPVSLVDAAFTAASAACVTGLAVVDTGTRFSVLGQCIILALIQVGGLGILSFTAFAAVFGGQGLRDTEAREIGRLLEVETVPEIRRSLLKLFALTFLVEALGAALLYGPMAGRLGDGFVAAFYAIFHSVSAFCNAGFGLFADNVASFRNQSLAMAAFCALILAGSLGTGVLEQTPRALLLGVTGRWREAPRHVRVVLGANLALVAGGAAAFWLLEKRGSMAGWDAEAAFWGSVFLPVTARTCGFELQTTAALGTAALALLSAMMFVGGSPASTAGGVKTTSLAVAWAWAVSRFTGRAPRLAGLPVQAAEASKVRWVVVGLLAVLAASSGLLMLAEGKAGVDLAFEALSAVCTVGLSLGATAELSTLGKLVVIAGMVLGRVGPACLVLSWALRYPATRPDRDTVGVG